MKIETAQGVVYRYKNDELELLILKRIPADGGFWQAITGSIDSEETAIETLLRELEEEAGIINPIHVSERLEEYHWELPEKGLVGRDQVFGVEISPDTKIRISSKEHSDFKWLPLEQAVEFLKYDGNKKSMKLVAVYAHKR